MLPVATTFDIYPMNICTHYPSLASNKVNLLQNYANVCVLRLQEVINSTFICKDSLIFFYDKSQYFALGSAFSNTMHRDPLIVQLLAAHSARRRHAVTMLMKVGAKS